MNKIDFQYNYIETRKEDQLFTYFENGDVELKIHNYAIIPLETYYELKKPKGSFFIRWLFGKIRRIK